VRSGPAGGGGGAPPSVGMAAPPGGGAAGAGDPASGAAPADAPSQEGDGKSGSDTGAGKRPGARPPAGEVTPPPSVPETPSKEGAPEAGSRRGVKSVSGAKRSAGAATPAQGSAGADAPVRRGHKKMRLTETTPRPAYASGVAEGRGAARASPAGARGRAPGDAGGEQVLSLPKDLRTRWSRERYESAQRSLMDVLGHIGATSSAQAVLRPALREEARKVVGDTGLLDHLLRHMPDSCVIAGQVVRRVHDQAGHMVYWIEAADLPRSPPGGAGGAPAGAGEGAAGADGTRALSSVVARLAHEARGVMREYREGADLAALQAEAGAAAARARRGLAELAGGAGLPAPELARRLGDALGREVAMAARVEEVAGAVAERMGEAARREAEFLARLAGGDGAAGTPATVRAEGRGGAGGRGRADGAPGVRRLEALLEEQSAQVEALKREVEALREGRGSGRGDASPTLSLGQGDAAGAAAGAAAGTPAATPPPSDAGPRGKARTMTTPATGPVGHARRAHG